MTPMPPSRASAIARRASVTVSIAAETSGISSSIVRVSRVRVETSLGRTADSAGTSSTSSNVSPSFRTCALEREEPLQLLGTQLDAHVPNPWRVSVWKCGGTGRFHHWIKEGVRGGNMVSPRGSEPGGERRSRSRSIPAPSDAHRLTQSRSRA